MKKIKKNKKVDWADQKYNLTLTVRQARVVKMATELLARIGMGQIEEITNHSKIDIKNTNYDEKTLLFKRLKKILFPDLQENESYGIGNRKIDNCYNISWSIYEVIRFHLNWDDPTETQEEKERCRKRMVGYDTPMNFSGLELPKFEKN